MGISELARRVFDRRSRVLSSIAAIVATSVVIPLAAAVGNAAPTTNLAAGIEVTSVPPSAVAVRQSTLTSNSPASSTDVNPSCSSTTWDYDVTKWSDFDVYHFLVQAEKRRGNDVSADFYGSPPGSAYLQFLDKPGKTFRFTSFPGGANNVQDDHLYIAVPKGSTVTKAWLDYQVVGGSGPLNSNHNLSHTCASPVVDPTITINGADAAYEQTWDENHEWVLAKSLLEARYEEGETPRFEITATRLASVAVPGSFAIVNDTQIVSGTFTITDTTTSQVAISLALESRTVPCTIGANTSGTTYEYSCVVGTESTVTGENGLKNLAFTVTASVTGTSVSTTNSGAFGDQSANSGPATVTGVSATLTDDLAGLGGAIESCDTAGGSCDDLAEIVDDELVVGPIDESFSVVYSIGWDYTEYYDDLDGVECGAKFTNNATLDVADLDEPLTDLVESEPSCPEPTVTMSDVESTYEYEYTTTYDWTIEKTYDGQEPGYGPPSYTVTATRSFDSNSTPKVTSAEITGSIDTTFANTSNVSVTVSIGGDEPTVCSVDNDAGTFTCVVDVSRLSATTEGLDAANDFTVTAEVKTGGGTTSDDVTDSWTLAEDGLTVDYENVYGVVEDDLAELDLSGTATCTAELDGATSECNAVVVADPGSPSFGHLRTDAIDADEIVVTYTLDWDYVDLDAGADCPTLANLAWVENNDGIDFAEDETEEEMTCPSPDVVIDLASLTPTYDESWTETYDWTFTKRLMLDDGETAKSQYFDKGLPPEFELTAERSADTTKSDWSVDDTTQIVTGEFTVTMSSGYYPWVVDGTSVDDYVSFTLEGEWSAADCSIEPLETPDTDEIDGLTYAFSCVVDDETGITGENGLDGIGFTVDASASVYGNDDSADGTGTWGDRTNDSPTFVDKTAYITDDLAKAGGVVTSCTEGNEGLDCNAEIEGTDLTSDEITDQKMVVTYTLDWDWTEKDDTSCVAELVNNAVLWSSDTDEEIVDADVEFDTNCPTPTINVDSVETTYDMEYDDVYAWTIDKELTTQDETSGWKPVYTVTATRTGPTAGGKRVTEDSATVTGEITVSFAVDPSREIMVTATYDDVDYECSVEPLISVAAVTDPSRPETLSYTCSIDGLSSTDIDNGVDGDAVTVTAEVTTPGGDGSDENTGTWSTPANVTKNDVHATARIVDDLGGLSVTEVSSNATIIDDELVSDPSSTTFSVTYTLDWDYTAEDVCGDQIVNTAEVRGDDDESLDEDATNDAMDCPVITLSVTSSATYDTEVNTINDWSVDKRFVKSELLQSGTYKLDYSLIVTKSSSNSEPTLVEGSPKVSGTFTVSEASATKVGIDIVGVDGESCKTTPDQSDTGGTYECLLPDGTTLSDLVGTVSVTAAVTENWGDDDDTADTTWSVAAGSPKVGGVVDEEVYLSDDLAELSLTALVTSGNATNSGGSLLSNSFDVAFTVNYSISGVEPCTSPINTVVLYGDDDEQVASDDVTATVPCPAVAGLTIGYWGNKMGGPEVVARRKDNWTSAAQGWATRWPALSTIGSTWKTDADVRNYMNKATCDKGCETMFLAQALASAMNVFRNEAYGQQSVRFKGQCVQVSKLMADALGSSSKTSWPSGALRVDYKSIFDDLNNTRATRCIPG